MARDLAYYRAEEKRHPALHATGIAFDDAVEMIRRFGREYEMPAVQVTRTSGCRSSHASGSLNPPRICLNTDHLNVLLVLHEFAHLMDAQDRERTIRAWSVAEEDFCRNMRLRFPLAYPGKFAFADQDEAPRATGTATPAYKAWLREHPRPADRKWHSAPHAEFVDILARKVTERGWIGEIPQERATRDLAKQEKRQQLVARAADPIVIRSKKIEKRRAQVVRLETAIKRCWAHEKALNTRLARARRSLAMLERHATKEP
jgi:hypothetical protein